VRLSRRPAPHHSHGGSDCASFIFGTHASVDDWSAKLGRPMDLRPLRINVMLSDPAGKLQAWEEDFWAGLQASTSTGTIDFKLTANCPRCNSLDVDYDTGTRKYPKGKNMPLKSIMGSRRPCPLALWR
jgi:uncharacterized protein YcbX